MSDTNHRLFLLDAYALIFRAYFAFANNPRRTSKGLETSAIYGFTTTLLEVLEKENPTHIAVVFDTSAPTERHIIFPEYKAHRDETPEGIRVAVPYIHKILEAFRIPILFMDGYEADDVIGTLAKRAEKQGYVTYMMTPDKDFGQLVSDKIFMYKPARAGGGPEIWGVKEICEKFGINNVDQVVDFLGMKGDAADNIPGIPSVGDKTASKLIIEYGSMENMFAHADEIKGKLGENIRNFKEQGLLSKKLARIITDVPIEFNEVDITRDPIDQEKLKAVFEELEFRTLAKRILGENLTPGAPPPQNTAAAPKLREGDQMDMFGNASSSSTSRPLEEVQGGASSFQTIATTDHLYQLLTQPEECRMFAAKLLKQKSVAWDTETTSLDPVEAELVGMSFSYAKGKAYYINMPTSRQEAQGIVDLFKPFFMDENIEKVGQNLKYDMAVLEKYGVEVRGPIFDTMLAHYLLQPDMRHGIDVLAETYLRYEKVHTEELIGSKGKNQGNMRDVAPEKVAEYAGEDADIALQLKQLFEPKLVETGVQKVFSEIETPLVPVLADMEYAGVNIDVPGLNAYSAQLNDALIILEKEITDLAGFPFNIGSPKQLGEVLFDHLKLLSKPKKTKTGQYATGEEVLVTLKDKHPIIEKILDYRETGKLKSTYVDALPKLINPKTGRVHTTFNQTVAATGRLSSTNPNLQNIPIRTEKGRYIRKMFVPRDENHLLLSADYSQIELRIIAALSNDASMIGAFKNGEDIHAATAAKVFGIPLNEVTRQQRSNAKAVNFGLIYGQGAFGLAQQTGLSRTEAKEIIEQYFATYPGILTYMETQQELARKLGYVETIMGRKRYLRDINSQNAVVRSAAERNAINAPIQGSAADVIKIAMINIYRKMASQKFTAKMVLQVHDELVFDVPKTEVDDLEALVKHEMENAVQLEVPLLAESGKGNNWLEAH
jgi:DNA polymerase-1